jgi:hypothetical protein
MPQHPARRVRHNCATPRATAIDAKIQRHPNPPHSKDTKIIPFGKWYLAGSPNINNLPILNMLLYKWYYFGID